VRAVAIGTDGGFHRAVFNGTAVNAVLVGDKGLGADAVRLHQKLLPVASAAGDRDMRMVDGRIGMTASENVVGITMTVLAIRGNSAAGDDLGMCAVRVGGLRVGMAIGAEDLLGRRLVGETFDVLVAVHASEFHGAVDGVLQLLAVHIERNGLAVHIGAQGCVTVAGEAVFIFQLVLGARGESRAQQKERQRTEQYSAGNFHAYEKTPVRF